MNFWKWLLKLSPAKASIPNPTPSTENLYNCNFPGGGHPIEMSVEQDNLIGSRVSFGIQNSVGRGTNGQLLRIRSKTSILCGCGHIASNLHAENEHGKSATRGIAGQCLYCAKECRELEEKGYISEADADRMSLVCTDCARMASGVLCCTRHCIAVEDGNGGVIYISRSERERQKQEELVHKILSPVFSFFCEPSQSQLPQPENNNA